MKKWYRILSNYRWWAQKENERIFREEMRRLDARQRAVRKEVQDNCPHLSGSLGENPSHLTSIVWHTLNTGEEFGLCIACGREFRKTDPDFLKWRSKPCNNTPSSAGRPALFGDDTRDGGSILSVPPEV